MEYVAPPELLNSLKEAGVTAISAANNHTCDMGTMGVRTTLASSQTAGLTTVGLDAGSAPFTFRVIAEKDGKKVCAVAWTDLMNSHSCEGSSLVAYAPPSRKSTAQIVTAITKARESCDAVVAIFHGGSEYAPQTDAMMAQATRAADAGADAVIMHHPHIVSPMTKHTTKDGRTVPIFASLGNLVTNQGESWKPPMFPVLRTDRHLVCVNGWTRLGMLADLAFSFSGTHKALSYASHLVYIENEHANDKAAKMPKIDVRMLSPEGDKDVIARLRDDKIGPTPVFDDPCWFEASGKRCDADVDPKSKDAVAANDLGQDPGSDDAEEPKHSRRLTAAHVSTKKSHKKP
jgi:poly-gamma-glutamate synthesis protein (capsule biosynthesis protein)